MNIQMHGCVAVRCDPPWDMSLLKPVFVEPEQKIKCPCLRCGACSNDVRVENNRVYSREEACCAECKAGECCVGNQLNSIEQVD